MNNTCHVTIHLNARLQPMHRHDLEDAIQLVLGKLKLGAVDGGGTLQKRSGEIEACDIELSLQDTEPATMETLIRLINGLGVPKGSEIQYGTATIPVGTQGGLALYLNGTQLPAEVYQTCDINEVIATIEHLLGDTGRMYSYWEGPQDTALYFYGNSYEEMLEKVQPFLKAHPLCQKCRVEQIA